MQMYVNGRHPPCPLLVAISFLSAAMRDSHSAATANLAFPQHDDIAARIFL